MASLERRCFPAFGTCWISAACHPPWTAVSSSAATQRIGAVSAVPAATGMLRQKLDVMRKEVEIAWPLQKQGIISKNKGLMDRAHWPSTKNKGFWTGYYWRRVTFGRGGEDVLSHAASCVCWSGPKDILGGHLPDDVLHKMTKSYHGAQGGAPPIMFVGL